LAKSRKTPSKSKVDKKADPAPVEDAIVV